MWRFVCNVRNAVQHKVSLRNSLALYTLAATYYAVAVHFYSSNRCLVLLTLVPVPLQTLETFVDILISGVDPVGPTHAAALPPGFFVSLFQVKHLFAHSSGSRGRSLPHSSITRAIDEVDGEPSPPGAVSSASSTLGNTTDCEAYENDRRTPPRRSRWNLNTLLDRLRLYPRSSRQRLHEQ
ncbi:hypothetical protein EDD15DRAFT_2517598 [Pisolithus albus]|nr:hypothetical protein EDD15DRAFT_2517598 [Pisolithus albus]